MAQQPSLVQKRYVSKHSWKFTSDSCWKLAIFRALKKGLLRSRSVYSKTDVRWTCSRPEVWYNLFFIINNNLPKTYVRKQISEDCVPNGLWCPEYSFYRGITVQSTPWNDSQSALMTDYVNSYCDSSKRTYGGVLLYSELKSWSKLGTWPRACRLLVLVLSRPGVHPQWRPGGRDRTHPGQSTREFGLHPKRRPRPHVGNTRTRPKYAGVLL